MFYQRQDSEKTEKKNKMAYSVSRPDLQKMRKESEREEIMRKLRLENEIQLLAQERELLTMEICQTEGMQLTDKDCEAQDERELRKCRRERKKRVIIQTAKNRGGDNVFTASTRSAGN